jgi:hypothetical protein
MPSTVTPWLLHLSCPASLVAAAFATFSVGFASTRYCRIMGMSVQTAVNKTM